MGPIQAEVKCDFPENISCFVRMLPFTDQAPMYNSVNFNLTSSKFENLTICGVRLSILTCPSDTQNDPVALVPTTPNASFNSLGTIGFALPPGNWIHAFGSYAGNAGTWDFGYTRPWTARRSSRNTTVRSTTTAP
jgi:hypothetical protein